ncbi:TatD family hydrolase [Nibricoccus sp. IMCC34717]|uniref:TatD family hydrolase n=1 Tax=Nibricoccus sp. IMCC34717 TaxID=3034021 RepID=UPI00384F9CFF
MYFDAHNHAHDEWLLRHREAIDRQLEAIDLRAAVVNGTCEQDWPEVIAFCADRRWARLSLGLHPWDAGSRTDAWLDTLKALLQAHPESGVGEIGLDRWMLDRAKPDDPRLAGLRRAPASEQVEVFTLQLQLAAELRRPATLHCVDAWGLLREVLEAAPALPKTFLLHAYGGPAELVKPFAEMGAFFSFNGYYLAPGREKRLEVFRSIPRERLLVETDAPAMALPAAWRTHKIRRPLPGAEINHPANIEAAYAGLAAFLGETKEDLMQQVERAFGEWWGLGD